MNRETLDEFSEFRIEHFRDFLGHVVTVEDLFPPDECSACVPRRPIPPVLINAVHISLEECDEPKPSIA